MTTKTINDPLPAYDKQAIARSVARMLIEIKAVLFRADDPFTLTSGAKSPVYIDCRKIISFPRARAAMMDHGKTVIMNDVGFESLDALAGGETAGIPFAAWIAERLGLPMLYIRKKPKGFGRNARIEGELRPGQRVLLVEDLATDGGSKLSFIDAVREAEGEIAHCLVVFHYGNFPESTQSLADRGVALHGLCTWWDVLAAAEQRGYTAEQIAEVRHFLNDADGWAAA